MVNQQSKNEKEKKDPIIILKCLHESLKDRSAYGISKYAQEIISNKHYYPPSIVDYACQIIERYIPKTSNGYHLSINPSYATKHEIEFWNQFHQKVDRKNSTKIKEIRFRAFSEVTRTEDCTILPARLADLNSFFSRKYQYSITSLPSWISVEDVALHVDWEHRRWQIDKYDAQVEMGFVQLCWYINSLINKEECISVITSNKIDHPNRVGFLASQRLKKNYSFVERSPFMGHLVEPKGMFSESKLKDFLVKQADNSISITRKFDGSAKDILVNNIYGFRPQQARLMGNDENSSPYLFFPLDNLIWTGWEPLGHPQGRIDYPYFWNISKLLTLIVDFCDTNGLRVIVKPHPSCKEYPRLAKAFPSIAFQTDIDLVNLIREAKVIVCGLTKVAFNAAALGKHVITVGENPANYLPNVHNCFDDSDLISKMYDAIHLRFRAEINSADQILSKIHEYYSSSESSFLKTIRASQVAIKNKGINANIAHSVKIKKQRVDLADRIIVASNSGKIPVVFDISRLMKQNLVHSGISKFAFLLFRELNAISEIDLLPFISSFPKVADGLSAHELNATFESLSIDSAFSLDEGKLELIEEKFIYYSPHWALPPVGKKAQRVITLHDVLHLTEVLYEGAEVRKFTQGIIDSIRPVDHVVSVSKFSKRELQKIRPDLQNFSVVNLPPILTRLSGGCIEVRDSIRSLVTRLRRSFILIPVQGDHRKQLNLMVEASAAVIKSNKRLECIFFGKDSSASLLKSATDCQALRLGANCHFIDTPSDQELHYLYQNALTTLYLSNCEGYGLPPLEALSAGCLPIVLMTTGLTDSMHGYFHGLDVPASLQEICDKISEFTELSSARYWEEVLRCKMAMMYQLNISLGDEYCHIFQDNWLSSD